VVGALTASALALAIPAAGHAATRSGGGVSGGAGVTTAAGTPAAGASSSAKATNPLVQPGNGTVTAAGLGIVLNSHAAGFLRNKVSFTGTVPSGDAGDIVEIERLGHQTDWQWAPTAHATVAPGGSFTVVWRANHIGRFAFRAAVERAVGGAASATSPAITVTVYRFALATQEGGPGLDGHRTACGQTLRPSTIGTANRTLSCGEKVAIYYQGRTLTVPVIDRGPYAHGADFDITVAAAQRLGLGGITRIGAVSVPPPPSRVATTFK
jgi:peptidoglycan lytic transglycosylase